MERKTLILIGSSQTLVEISKRILERIGYSIHCAEAIAEEVIKKISEVMPDGIILLSSQNNTEGIELCRELRRVCTTPILFTSNSKDDELPALQAGANDFVKKPFDYQILKARINVMLNTKVGAITNINEENYFCGNPGKSGYDTELRPKESSKTDSASAMSRRIERERTIIRPCIIAAVCIMLALLATGVFIAIRSARSIAGITDGSTPIAETSKS